MKKLLITKPTAIAAIFLLVAVFYGCSGYENCQEQRMCEKYVGGIIYQRWDCLRPILYTVKYKGNIIKVEVYEIDNYYQTGDTIKNCH